jgi:uncharacterized membrane protein YoaK (UPF0700 family)
MAPIGSEPSLRTAAAAVLLTVASGFVDAFGLLTLGGVFTSHVTGNTVMIGVYAFAKRGNLMLRVFSVLMFLAGLILGGLAIELASRSGRRGFALALAAEALLLTALIAILELAPGSVEGWPAYALVALSAVAMGAQNTSLGTSGILSEYTTHITGTITRFAQHVVAWLTAPRTRRSASNAEARAVLFSAALCFGFLGGALVASAMGRGARVLGLLLPVAIVLGVALADIVAPFPRQHRRA